MRIVRQIGRKVVQGPHVKKRSSPPSGACRDAGIKLRADGAGRLPCALVNKFGGHPSVTQHRRVFLFASQSSEKLSFT
nr:MAG TPA: hypothetical protein [Caudoviricetes sp.]